MNVLRLLQLFLTSVILTAAGIAGAVNIYKYVLPDGSVLYTQTALKNVKPAKILHVPPPDDRLRQEQRSARRELERLQVRADQLSLLSTAKEMAENQACVTAPGQAPPAVMSDVLVPLPGERTGTAGGFSRLNEAYWERVGAQLGARYESREQLDRALAEAGVLQ